jgi:hypothetical protein
MMHSYNIVSDVLISLSVRPDYQYEGKYDRLLGRELKE